MEFIFKHSWVDKNLSADKDQVVRRNLLNCLIPTICRILPARRFLHLLLLLLPGAILQGCSSSLQLANRFVLEETDIHVWLDPPPALNKVFLTTAPGEDPVPGEDSAPGEEVNDTLPDQEAVPRFLEEVEDSLYIDYFMDALQHRLELLYVNWYGPGQEEEFRRQEGDKYIFDVAQLELVEYIDHEAFYAEHRDGYHRDSVEITVLENNVWFEFRDVNGEDPDEQDEQVLFSLHATSDYVDGRFVRDPDTGDIRLDTETFPLTRNDVLDLAWFAGEQNADNVFNHLLNRYIRKRLEYDPPYSLYYNMQDHRIIRREDPPFIRLD